MCFSLLIYHIYSSLSCAFFHYSLWYNLLSLCDTIFLGGGGGGLNWNVFLQGEIIAKELKYAKWFRKSSSPAPVDQFQSNLV
jgi:hypothetical protein